MITRFNPFLILVLTPIVLAACMSPEPATARQTAAVPLGIDLGGSGPATPPAHPLPPPQAVLIAGAASGHSPGGGMQMAHDGRNDTHAIGTINSVDSAQHKINVSHEPIPAIGWPAMTMDFAVVPNVDLRAIKPGARINFTIEKGQDGMYQIQAITPAAGGR